MSEVKWPQITGIGIECLTSLIVSLEQTELLSAQQLAEHQTNQLEVLLAHTATHSSFMHERLKRARIDVKNLLKPEVWGNLHPLSRRDIQAHAGEMVCAQIPARHHPLNYGITSGSTGEPVKVLRTGLNRLFWMAMTMREHAWNNRDFSQKLTAVRANIPKPGYQDDWGPPASLLKKTGRSQGLPITSTAAEQADWINDFGPTYLLHYPNSFAALLDHCERHSVRLRNLRQVRSMGETLSNEIRQRTRDILGVTIVDTYSSNEIGVIAIECPTSGKYHVMAENLIVEVINDKGMACNSGEVGRVLLTDLHNFATPIIRYDIGDYAEVGGPCPCGRGLPTLNRIAGRERNLVMLPDGRRHWPLVGFAEYREVAPVIQYQLAQRSLEQIEFRLVVSKPLTQVEEAGLRDIAQKALGYRFDIQFKYFADEIPRQANGKFDEFVREFA